MIYRNDCNEAVECLEYQRTQGYGEGKNDAVYTCESCGGEIYEGEDYLDCGEGIFCRRCIMALTSEDVVELLGFTFKSANTKDIEF